MSRKSAVSLSFFLAAAATGLPLSAAAAAQAEFVPHRASYELLLIPGRGDGSVASAGGRLDFEWADVCDGWAVNQRTRVVMSEASGGELDFGWALTTWEAKDGLAFDYVVQRYQNGEVFETLQGDATLAADGSGGTARFEEPVRREIELPPGTLFPTDHTFVMLNAAAAGELPTYDLVFDASSEHDGLSAVSAAPAGRIAGDGAGTFDSPLLKGQEAWRILMAYYPPFGQAELPDTEVALRVYANGIADDFVFDYGDFALRARLTAVEALPLPEC
jgi:hypothetical protein